jgi:hypothetical protein
MITAGKEMDRSEFNCSVDVGGQAKKLSRVLDSLFIFSNAAYSDSTPSKRLQFE